MKYRIQMSQNKTLPDITSKNVESNALALEWVGMDKIGIPIVIDKQTFVASANVYVSLDDANVKGIHMSRLYAKLNEMAKLECNATNLHQLLITTLDTQQGISGNARLSLSFEYIINKPSLLSANTGYQSYPINIDAHYNGQQTEITLNLTIPYSSTCPCSASLSRQLYSEAIDTAFEGESISKVALLDWGENQAGSVATPHSQRSYAYLSLTIQENYWPSLAGLIKQFEQVIGTPVQTAVKRLDEQEFARLNAENLMFCEDAARRVKAALLGFDWLKDYWFKVEHQESLHAHNAVVIDSKSSGRLNNRNNYFLTA